MAIKRELPMNNVAQDREAVQHGYRAMLPGMEYALKRIVTDLNQIRTALGLREVEISGLDEGSNGEMAKGGITDAGRQKLRDMMKQRWQKAYQEGVHVMQLKPRRKDKAETTKKAGHE